MTTVSVQALTTKTAAFDGSSVDVHTNPSATTDWTLELEITALTGTARFQFTDSVDAFSNSLAGPTVSCSGTITSAQPKKYTFTKKDFPDMRFGVASAVLRLSLTAITASTGSVQYQAFLKY